MSGSALFVAVFPACVVEAVEAPTIVLAAGTRAIGAHRRRCGPGRTDRVVPEGLEVIFIVLTFGSNQHDIPLPRWRSLSRCTRRRRGTANFIADVVFQATTARAVAALPAWAPPGCPSTSTQLKPPFVAGQPRSACPITTVHAHSDDIGALNRSIAAAERLQRVRQCVRS